MYFFPAVVLTIHWTTWYKSIAQSNKYLIKSYLTNVYPTSLGLEKSLIITLNMALDQGLNWVFFKKKIQFI